MHISHKGLWPSASHVTFAAPEEWCRSAQYYRQAPSPQGTQFGNGGGPLFRVKSELVGCTASSNVGFVDLQERKGTFRCTMDTSVNSALELGSSAYRHIVSEITGDVCSQEQGSFGRN